MSDDDAFPEPYRREHGWTPPGQEGDMFAPTYPPVTHIDRDFAYTIPPVVPTSGYATASLVLGLATFVTMGISGVLAVIFGHFAISETKTGARGGHGMAITGLILGYLAIVGWALFLFLLSIGIIGAVSTGTSASHTWGMGS
jgi:hypothetical protein